MPGSCRASAGCAELLAAQDIPIIEKSDVRVRKRTEAPTLVSHTLVRQAQRGYPRQHLTMVELPRKVRDGNPITTDYSFAWKDENPVNDASMKAEVNTNTPNAKIEAHEKRGFDMPLFAMPGIFRGIAEQGVVRARDNCEKIKAASGEIADTLRETYSTNAKGAADYGVKVIEISGVNTNSAFDFLTHLMDTKSLSEIIKLSATQSRKNFEATSAQNRELWELAQKVATETAEPIKKSFTRVLQKAS
jgi:phasin